MTLLISLTIDGVTHNFTMAHVKILYGFDDRGGILQIEMGTMGFR